MRSVDSKNDNFGKDTNIVPVMFAVLRSAIDGNLLTAEERKMYDPQMLPKLMKLTKHHDIAQLLVYGLEKNDLLVDKTKEMSDEVLKAVYRYRRLEHESMKLCAAFEKAEIPFMLLKGSVMRKFYPQPWMRTSCDIDVLVHENDLERASSFLQEQCGYTFKEQNAHDISLFSPNGNHIELHYCLIEKGLIHEASAVLEHVWETSAVREGCRYQHEMTDEMFYFYHIVHMAKHFEIGGCGIRPLIDLWIMDGLEGADPEKREALLRQGEISKFAENVRKLNSIWFEETAYDPLSRQLEDYILCGGVYGNSANRIAVQQQKKGGSLKYAFSKIFLSYDVIKYHYPVLQKYPWLTPLMEVRRWGKLIFCGHLKRTVNELQYNQGISKDEAESVQKFLGDIGL